MLLLSLVSNYLATSRWLSLASLASLLRLGVGTAVWWGWARTAFPALEAATGRSLELSTGLREILQSPDKAAGIMAFSGHCPVYSFMLHVPRAAGVCTLSSHVSRGACLQAGHTWTGFDASGHCFLLSWNNLFMLEEFLLASRPIFSRDPGSKVTSVLQF